ncbi:MAG TPA: flippase-like domain-containing protein [Candidatus Aquabacterium excrementipullorum]|nr:flippase-like domain-containing protein [Candidatus Aquabacterium excrementipullorum]
MVFAVWCVLSFHKDLAQIHIESLHGGWAVVGAAGALSLLNYALRIVRWQQYMNQMGHRLPWRLSALSYMAGFAFTLSPGKVGEMVRARYYLPYKIPLQDVTAAFFAERLMDLIVILLLALAMLSAQPRYHMVMWLGLTLIGATIAALVAMPWARVQQWLGTHPAASRMHIRLMHGVAATLLNARRFLSPGLLLPALALGFIAWGAEAVGFKIVGDVIHPEGPMSWATAAGIYALATLVGALSFLPGGLGSTEAVMASLLYAQGFTVPDALLLTLICRVLTLWLAVVIGWLCVYLLRHER